MMRLQCGRQCNDTPGTIRYVETTTYPIRARGVTSNTHCPDNEGHKKDFAGKSTACRRANEIDTIMFRPLRLLHDWPLSQVPERKRVRVGMRTKKQTLALYSH